MDDRNDANDSGRMKPGLAVGGEDTGCDTKDICGAVLEFVTPTGELRPRGTVWGGVGVVDPLLSSYGYGPVPILIL